MATSDFSSGNLQDPRPDIDVIHENTILVDGSDKNMAVNGSGTPAVYQYAPGAGEVRYCERMTFVGGDTGNASWDKFFSITALSNGLLLEIKSKGITVTYSNITDNVELTHAFPDISSISAGSAAGGGGFLQDNDIFNGTIAFAAAIRLNGDSGDFIKATVRDNISALTFVSISADVWRVG